METFRYTKLAAESGKDGLVALGIFAAIAVFFIYKLSQKPEGLLDKSSVIILAVIAVFGVVAVKHVLAKLKSSGAWEIVIDDQKLQWHGPVGIDQQWTVKLKEIEQFRMLLSDNGHDDYYILVLKQGDEIHLSQESGLDFSEFSQALLDRGVTLDKQQIQTNE